MTVNAEIRNLYGGSPGNHTLGLKLKEAGVSVSGGVVTMDTTQAHRAQPRGQVAAVAPTAPSGYTKLCCGFSFNLGSGTGTIGAAHTMFQCESVANGSADAIKVTRNTSGVWTFIIAGVTIGTYTPTGTHHLILLASKVAAGVYSEAWGASETVWATVIVDKAVLYNQSVSAASAGWPVKGSAIFGESAGIGGSATFTWSGFAALFTDRANPIGKLTVDEWTFRLGITPPTGYDDASKSTGTDGAAVIDERPPGGSGTTDGDYYDFTDSGAETQQVNSLAQNILAAGDVLYATTVREWARTATSNKITGGGAALHDGTNFVQLAGNAITGPSSYAEIPHGNAGVAIWNTAPDGAAYSGKANAYLNGMNAGAYQTAITANANYRMDAVVVEKGMVLSGDTISAIADPVASQIFHHHPAFAGISGGIV